MSDFSFLGWTIPLTPYRLFYTDKTENYIWASVYNECISLLETRSLQHIWRMERKDRANHGQYIFTNRILMMLRTLKLVMMIHECNTQPRVSKATGTERKEKAMCYYDTFYKALFFISQTLAECKLRVERKINQSQDSTHLKYQEGSTEKGHKWYKLGEF